MQKELNETTCSPVEPCPPLIAGRLAMAFARAFRAAPEAHEALERCAHLAADALYPAPDKRRAWLNQLAKIVDKQDGIC